MNPIKKLLVDMKGRVPMYIGTTSLKHLAMFLRGVEQGLDVAGVSHNNFLNEIADNVRLKFDYEGTKAWEDVVLFYARSDECALDEFWLIFDQVSSLHAD